MSRIEYIFARHLRIQPSEMLAMPYYDVEYFMDYWKEEQEEQEKQQKNQEKDSSLKNYTKDFNKQMSSMQNNFNAGNLGSNFKMPNL